LWVLYPSGEEAVAAADEVRAAVADGTLTVPGAGDPFIAATTIREPVKQDRSDR